MNYPGETSLWSFWTLYSHTIHPLWKMANDWRP